MELVGEAVSVEWVLGRSKKTRWYDGHIISYDDTSGTHTIFYPQDGEEQEINVAEHEANGFLRWPEKEVVHNPLKAAERAADQKLRRPLAAEKRRRPSKAKAVVIVEDAEEEEGLSQPSPEEEQVGGLPDESTMVDSGPVADNVAPPPKANRRRDGESRYAPRVCPKAMSEFLQHLRGVRVEVRCKLFKVLRDVLQDEEQCNVALRAVRARLNCCSAASLEAWISFHRES
eukprot:7388928-Prymnesium_polylepis.1